MNRDPRARSRQPDGKARPAESTRETESRAREAVVDAWRRALHRMRERRAAQDRADPGR
ncbi:hypothetical protein ABID82_003258 [Methylobacterium sp. PvP062]|uniref:Uncharacterized protein n=1 Tax=Methylobacterium radiotolerans TaxID=31998 RepID=A0ABV2NC39_9HYPH|nr:MULTISPECIES: hypothetical protein [unclassified Methylobacterium]MBP2492706.1 hypothetical protein [Methylobacterium sp. PvP105]MBP2500922.1 hypothetical protein [Methylobacterium sp. PvP109]MCX7335644.1 hypothetical protein [Hyphomicrobiales bacterium]